MSERLKEHDWKSCGAKVLGGSNPPLSAMNFPDFDALPVRDFENRCELYGSL